MVFPKIRIVARTGKSSVPVKGNQKSRKFCKGKGKFCKGIEVFTLSTCEDVGQLFKISKFV